jgi:hypothetical protein
MRILLLRRVTGESMEEDKPNIGLALYGNDSELKQLSDFLDSPNCHLQFNEEENRYYLVSSRFSNLTSNEQIKLARKLLATIRAFAKIEKGWDFQSITIGRGKTIVEHNKAIAIVEEGKDSRSVNLMLSTINGGTGEAMPATVSINGVVQTPAVLERETQLSDFLDPCEELEKGTYDVLSDFALVASWTSLQRILKTVESDIGKNVEKMGWAKKGKRARFFTSATHYDALVEVEDDYLGSDRGRHPKYEYEKKAEAKAEQVKKGKKERNIPPVMHLPEAESFIGCVVKEWLKYKHKKNPD